MDTAVIASATILDSPADAHERLVALGSGAAALCLFPNPAWSAGNEDVAAVVPVGERSGLLIVADGCGGHASGGAAARRAVAALVESVDSSGASEDPEELREAVMRGFDDANNAVMALGVGAACTLAAVEVHEDCARTYHVGDSQVVITGQRGRIRRITIPHSPVGYAVEAGILLAEDAMHHEERHLVSNLVGLPDMRIDVGPITTLGARDTVIVGSDGLFDNLHVEEIVELVRKGPLDAAPHAVRDATLERMRRREPNQPSKPDDTSFVIFRPH